MQINANKSKTNPLQLLTQRRNTWNQCNNINNASMLEQSTIMQRKMHVLGTERKTLLLISWLWLCLVLVSLLLLPMSIWLSIIHLKFVVQAAFGRVVVVYAFSWVFQHISCEFVQLLNWKKIQLNSPFFYFTSKSCLFDVHQMKFNEILHHSLLSANLDVFDSKMLLECTVM